MNFVLVHGAYHGAWCWDLLRPELERAGHKVTAIDMPISDPASAGAEYARAVIDGADWAEPPTVVAHSMGGLIAPLVAATQPVARLVFLAAFLPKPGMSANDQRRDEQLDPPFAPTASEWTDLGDDTWAVGPTTATELFFNDVPADVTRWAVGRLRPQCYRVMNEITPLQRWPDVPSTYIVCRDDHGINPEWGRMAARGRLGVEPIEIDGGHSPMLSRPAELAGILGSFAARTPRSA